MNWHAATRRAPPIRLFALLTAIALAIPAPALAQGTPSSTSAPPPCLEGPFRAFDFWLGEWDVHLADGTLAGRNRIRLREGQCVLLEQWVGASGSTGMSMNFYEPARDRWRQVWHSATGALIDIAGGLDGESMVLKGTIEYVASATRHPFRGTWTPLKDGRLRQFFEQSNDGGATWEPWFEGFYTRREPSAGAGSP